MTTNVNNMNVIAISIVMICSFLVVSFLTSCTENLAGNASGSSTVVMGSNSPYGWCCYGVTAGSNACCGSTSADTRNNEDDPCRDSKWGSGGDGCSGGCAAVSCGYS